MKKRLLSLALALALCLGLAVSVSAEGLEDNYEIFSVVDSEYTLRAHNTYEGGTIHASHSGVKDKAGNVVIPADYISLKFINHPTALVARKHVGNYGWYADGIIDINQNVLVPFQYDSIRIASGARNSEYLEIADLNTYLRGILSPDFSVIVPMKYYEVEVLSSEDGYFKVTDTYNDQAAPDVWFHFSSANSGKWGIYNKYGTMIIPCIYDRIEYLGDGYFSVKQGEVVGVLNSQGKVVLPIEYSPYHGSTMNGIFYHKNTFTAFKYVSQEYRQRAAAGESAPDTGELWTTVGVVDVNNNILIDFSKYQTISYDEHTDTFKCGRWTGEYVADRVQVVGGATHYVNEYEYDYIKYDSLKAASKPVTPPASTTIGGFTDVKETDYFANPVLWAVEKGVTSGTSATTFSPNSTCSNAQILTFLWRAYGSSEVGANNSFTDVKESDYYYKAAQWAKERGLVTGTALEPNIKCTRAMTMEYLWKLAGKPTPSAGASFSDVSSNAPYAQAVAWAVEKGVTSGVGGGRFSPDSTCTRGQIVTFLYQALK